MKNLSLLFTHLFIAVIRGYQIIISPYISNSCRFAPTCSQFAVEAISCHGPVAGIFLTSKRILKCHPWGDTGYDPVPRKVKASVQKNNISPSDLVIK